MIAITTRMLMVTRINNYWTLLKDRHLDLPPDPDLARSARSDPHHQSNRNSRRSSHRRRSRAPVHRTPHTRFRFRARKCILPRGGRGDVNRRTRLANRPNPTQRRMARRRARGLVTRILRFLTR